MKIQKWKKLGAASPNLSSFLILLNLILSLFDHKRFQIECSLTAGHLYWESLREGAGNAEWKPDTG